MRITDLKNAIWKQLPFSNNYSIFNKKAWRDFVFCVKETSNTFYVITKPARIISDVGKNIFLSNANPYKSEEIPLYTSFMGDWRTYKLDTFYTDKESI